MISEQERFEASERLKAHFPEPDMPRPCDGCGGVPDVVRILMLPTYWTIKCCGRSNSGSSMRDVISSWDGDQVSRS